MRRKISRAVSTRDDVEMTLVWVFVLVRAVDLVQATAGVLSVGSATRPAVYLAFLSLAWVESVAVALLLRRRRSVLKAKRIVSVDVVFGLMLLLTMPLYVAAEHRVGSWLAWAFPLTLSTAGLIGISTTGAAWRALTGSLLLGGAYVGVVSLPQLAINNDAAASGFANACAYPAFAGVLWLFARFVRDIADQADSARRRVAELERIRSRAVVHDMLAYLRLDRLLDARPETQLLLVEQALTKYRQMRAYVDGTDQPGDVEGCLRSVVELYPTMAPRLVLHLADGVVVDDDVAVSLRQAVDTALSNVQQSAPDASVVLTAESEDRRVVVTIVDDGPGFDASVTVPGFGIAETLGRQLELVGGVGTVTSRPGVGTQVEIVVPRDVG